MFLFSLEQSLKVSLFYTKSTSVCLLDDFVEIALLGNKSYPVVKSQEQEDDLFFLLSELSSRNELHLYTCLYR